MLRSNYKYLALVFMAFALVFSGCGEEDDDDGTTGATLQITDTTAPTGSIYLNSIGDASTNNPLVTLHISASDDYSGVSQMCVSDSTTCSAWETYATSKSWTLTGGDGVKTLYVWFKDNGGYANSSPYSGTIILDTTAPVDGSLTATAVSGAVTLDWSGFSDSGSGIQDYTLVYNIGGSAPVSCSAGTAAANFTYTALSGTYTFTQTTGLTSGTTTYYRLCATDWTGNISAGVIAQATP